MISTKEIHKLKLLYIQPLIMKFFSDFVDLHDHI